MVLHVIPVDDLVDHEPSDLCACGPRLEPVNRPNGEIRWLHVHHSLDGREQSEHAPRAEGL